ncbi:RWD-domain-containing protein [Flagelloscypha sp. PMI_526]|nr:RWD-domain-containing protein [Flagelloscypha sp. PMI_526]
MTSEILAEEFEVLESIYPTEFTKLTDTLVQVVAEPDELPEGFETFSVTLQVGYGEGYPETLPTLSLENLDEDQLSSEEAEDLLAELQSTAQENLGMPMTFTLVSLLREKLSLAVETRLERQKQEEIEKERREIEAEEARTRGTPVTKESFMAWKNKFDAEQKKAKQVADESFLRGLTAKEREEWKKVNSRLSGRQLFLKNTDLEEDNLEEGTSVDVTQYDRTRQDETEEDLEERVTFSDSD